MDKLFGGPVAANDNAERVCPMCGDAVTGSKSKKFCCAKCRRANERLNRDLDAERVRRKELAPERVCEHCGATFRRRSDSKNAARFCSRQCGFDAGSNVSESTVAICSRLNECVLHSEGMPMRRMWGTLSRHHSG